MEDFSLMESGCREVSDALLRVEVLVVGAGPAGSAAGIALRKAGRDCLVVDGRVFPRVKLCGGLLTRKSQGVLRELLGEEGYGELMGACLASRERRFSLWRAEGGRSCGGVATGGTKGMRRMRRVVEVEPREEIVLVDRPRMDEWMVRRYVGMGGRLIEGDGVVEVDFVGRVARLASGRRVEFGWMIGADGANSGVRRGLEGMMRAVTPSQHGGRERRRGKDSLCLEVNVRREDCPGADGVRIYFGVVPRSYAWSFAKGEVVCLGLVKLDGEEFDVREAMLGFMRDVGVRNVEGYALRGAMLPFGNYVEKVGWREAATVSQHGGQGAVLLAGDAAGLVEPLTGEGIYYALQSGVWAAGCGGDVVAYEERVRYLKRLIDKAWGYQRVLLQPRVNDFVCRHARRHGGFFEYFYSTQIEVGCLDGFGRIVGRYFWRKWRGGGGVRGW